MRIRLYKAETYERTLAPSIKAGRQAAIVSVVSRHIVSAVPSYAEMYFGSHVRTGFV